MEQTKWFDRKFDFNFTQNIFPSIMERLRGTPSRLEEKTRTIPIELLTVKINKNWSIKENIGHLIDLEPLWMGRLDDILNKENYLRATDLNNTKTDQANHNARDLDDVLVDFKKIRTNTVSKLERLTVDQIYQMALHPRLKTPMRTMDLFLFVAEHDDHHLIKINEILKSLVK
jgi:uncharacterized damage-inducible protein DinB